MKITMYELLGMVKDGKAPNKIKYDGMIWEYDGDFYSSKLSSLILDEYCNLTVSLNDKVEIIEEKKKIPEKITVQDLLDLDTGSLLKRIVDNQNEIIDYLKSKGE